MPPAIPSPPLADAQHVVKELLGRKFLMIAGKGGVGRTTVAAALARAACRQGKRVLLAQTNAPERLGRLLGKPDGIGPTITVIDHLLSAVNMHPRIALREYGVLLLKYEPIYRALFENKPVRSFLAAFPGLDYWSMLGKTWWHTTEMDGRKPKYDLVILDGPASGHAASMLRIPDAVQQAMPRGPLARDAGLAKALLSDPSKTSVVLVTLPEELPARETVNLAREIRGLRIPLGPLIVNAMPPVEAVDAAVETVLGAAASTDLAPDLCGIVAGVTVIAARRRDAERTVENLARDPGLPMIELPRLPTGDLGPQHIDELSARLERQ
jgi:anion-transporting  ArsA/GET3 family ATPase